MQQPSWPGGLEPHSTIPSVRSDVSTTQLVITDEDMLISQAQTMDQTSLYKLLEQLSESYHNASGLVDDKTFDELVDIYESKFGEYKDVGAVPRGQKVTLPYYMSGLKKMKKEAEITSWAQKYKGPYVIQDKIDGLTLLYTSSMIDGKRVHKLYTRGRNGIGLDVSHMFDDLSIPRIENDIAVRGEIVMTKETFNKIGQGFKNARNMVSGIVNAKDSYNSDIAKELKFIAYRIMDSKDTPEQQGLKLVSMGFTIPWMVNKQSLSIEELEQILQIRKASAPYEMDGLVVYQNDNTQYPVIGLPQHVIAFKMQTDTAETVVTEVIWEASKDRLLKPVIIYQPVVLSGATLQRTSGDNGRYIVNNGIGPGARIVITRSGDVIPRIVAVLQPAPQPSVPDPNIHGAYTWNTNEVEFVLLQDNSEVLAAKIEHFLSKLEVKNIGPARVKSMVDAGCDSIYKLLTATPEQLASIDRIGPNLAHQMCQEIKSKIQNVPLARIMGACGIFPGIGEKRFEAIIQQYPQIMSWCKQDPAIIEQSLLQVKGFKKLAHEIAIKLSSFHDWLLAHPMITIQSPVMQPVSPQPTRTPVMQPVSPQHTKTEPISSTLTGMTIVFSGFRDGELQNAIQQRGGKVTTSVSRNTTFLVMKDLSQIKGKAEKATELGVKVISRDQFVNEYIK